MSELELQVQTDWTARRHRRWVRHRHVVVAELAVAWTVVVVVGPNCCRAEWEVRRLTIGCLADKWWMPVPIRFQ